MRRSSVRRRLSGKSACRRCISSSTVIGRNPGDARSIGTISTVPVHRQWIGTTPAAWRALLGGQPGISIEPSTGAGAEAGLGGGGFAGVGSAVVHVQLRLLIGDVFAGHGEVSSGQLRTSPFRHPSRSRRRIPQPGTASTRGPAYGRATPNLRPTPASSIQIDAQTILIVAASRPREFGIVNRERAHSLLHQIEQALARLDNGIYGYCEDTGEPIDLRRLDAQPTATLTTTAQARRERTGT